jgi:hypothetical protein
MPRRPKISRTTTVFSIIAVAMLFAVSGSEARYMLNIGDRMDSGLPYTVLPTRGCYICIQAGHPGDYCPGPSYQLCDH